MTWQEAKIKVAASLRAHGVTEKFPADTLLNLTDYADAATWQFLCPGAEWKNFAEYRMYRGCYRRELRKRGAQVLDVVLRREPFQDWLAREHQENSWTARAEFSNLVGAAAKFRQIANFPRFTVGVESDASENIYLVHLPAPAFLARPDFAASALFEDKTRTLTIRAETWLNLDLHVTPLEHAARDLASKEMQAALRAMAGDYFEQANGWRPTEFALRVHADDRLAPKHLHLTDRADREIGVLRTEWPRCVAAFLSEGIQAIPLEPARDFERAWSEAKEWYRNR